MNQGLHSNDSINNNDSPLLLTHYSSGRRLIKSFTNNIVFVLMILFVIATMTIFDLSMDLDLSIFYLM